jgi:hypothetical protein
LRGQEKQIGHYVKVMKAFRANADPDSEFVVQIDAFLNQWTTLSRGMSLSTNYPSSSNYSALKPFREQTLMPDTTKLETSKSLPNYSQLWLKMMSYSSLGRMMMNSAKVKVPTERSPSDCPGNSLNLHR